MRNKILQTYIFISFFLFLFFEDYAAKHSINQARSNQVAIETENIGTEVISELDELSILFYVQQLVKRLVKKHNHRHAKKVHIIAKQRSTIDFNPEKAKDYIKKHYLASLASMCITRIRQFDS